jgi:hypothetical protein
MPKHTKHNPDYIKNRTADVIKHGDGPTVPNEHWQINMNLTPSGNDSGWGALLPRSGKDRPQPYTKTNECDH